jgi:hypothetical protein
LILSHSNTIKNSEGRDGIEGNTSRKEDAELVLDEERIRRRSTGETLISPISFLLFSFCFFISRDEDRRATLFRGQGKILPEGRRRKGNRACTVHVVTVASLQYMVFFL